MEPFGFVRPIHYGSLIQGRDAKRLRKRYRGAAEPGRSRIPCDNRRPCHPHHTSRRPRGVRARHPRPVVAVSRRVARPVRRPPSSVAVAVRRRVPSPPPIASPPRSPCPGVGRHRRGERGRGDECHLRHGRDSRSSRIRGLTAEPTGRRAAHHRGRAADDAHQAVRRGDATRVPRRATSGCTRRSG